MELVDSKSTLQVPFIRKTVLGTSLPELPRASQLFILFLSKRAWGTVNMRNKRLAWRKRWTAYPDHPPSRDNFLRYKHFGLHSWVKSVGARQSERALALLARGRGSTLSVWGWPLYPEQIFSINGASDVLGRTIEWKLNVIVTTRTRRITVSWPLLTRLHALTYCQPENGLC